MTSAFGGQRSIQLSYGCFQDRYPENEPAGKPASHGFLAEAGAGFNGQVAGAVKLSRLAIGPCRIRALRGLAGRASFEQPGLFVRPSLLPGIQQPCRRVRRRRQVALDQCFDVVVALARAVGTHHHEDQPAAVGVVGGDDVEA